MALSGRVSSMRAWSAMCLNIFEQWRRCYKRRNSFDKQQENIEALYFMKDLIVKYKVTPLVTTAIEEPTRHIYSETEGRSFMRNWPYAWNIFERKGSAIKGKVGVSTFAVFSRQRLCINARRMAAWCK